MNFIFGNKFLICFDKYQYFLLGPRPELDPDVVAGLDDDVDEVVINEGAACHPNDDTALPDHFVLMLNGKHPIETLSDEDGEWEDDDDDDDDIWGDEDEDKEMPALEEPYITNLPPPNILRLTLELYCLMFGHL